jgi:hypothetical protein
MHQSSLIARLATAVAGLMAPTDLSTIGGANLLQDIRRPSGIWPGLGHRGQPAARGILGGPVDPMSLGKNMGRRDKHRQRVAMQKTRTSNPRPATRPDFRAQIAQEAKAARGRKARAARAY